MNILPRIFLLFLLALSGLNLSAQSMLFQDIFQPNLGHTFRGVDLGMTYTQVNNATGIAREQRFDNPNVMFSYPLDRNGYDGDRLDGNFIYSQDETLKQVIARITLVDATEFEELEKEIRNYLDYEYGTGSFWRNSETRWQQGATRIVLHSEPSGTGGLLVLTFQNSSSSR